MSSLQDETDSTCVDLAGAVRVGPQQQQILFEDDVTEPLTEDLHTQINWNPPELGTHKVALLLDDFERGQSPIRVVPRIQTFGNENYTVFAGEVFGDAAGEGSGGDRFNYNTKRLEAHALATATAVGVGRGYYSGGTALEFELDAGNDNIGTMWEVELEITYFVSGTVNTIEVAGLAGTIADYFSVVTGGVARGSAPYYDEIVNAYRLGDIATNDDDLLMDLFFFLSGEAISVTDDYLRYKYGLKGASKFSIYANAVLALVEAGVEVFDCEATWDDEYTVKYKDVIQAGERHSAYIELDAAAQAGVIGLGGAHTLIDFGGLKDNGCFGPNEGLGVVSIRVLDATPVP